MDAGAADRNGLSSSPPRFAAWTAARHGCADASTNRQRTVALAEIASDRASGRRICRSACTSEGPMQAPMANAADEEIEKTYMELGVPVVVYGHVHVSHVRRCPE